MSHPAEREINEFEELPKPVVTYAILGVIFAVFVAMGAASHWQIQGFPDPVCDLFGYKQNDRMIVHGHIIQWWRFVTPIFLHGGLVHLLVNSYSLYVLGRQLEPFYGSRKYILVFMAAGIAGVAASVAFSSHVPSLGASGAIFGLVGAGIVFPIRFRSLVDPAQGRRIVKQLVLVAVLNLALGFSLRSYVDNAAHVGGLVGGGFAALFLLPDALDGRSRRRASESVLWVTCAAVTSFVILAAVAQARWAVGPWWRISMPSGFRSVSRVTQFEGSWKAADGSTIEISDSVHNENLFPISVYMLRRADLPINMVTIGPWHGRAFAFQNQNETVVLYMIAAYHRVVIVTFRCGSSRFAANKPLFDSTIKSLKFLHMPPPDLHPIPLAVRPQVNKAK